MMVKLEIVQGKKAPGDKLVLVTANREPLRLEHVLQILNVFFESEDACYPPSLGYQGRAMLFSAIKDVYDGEPIPLVINKYRLKKTRKGFKLSFRAKGGGG